MQGPSGKLKTEGFALGFQHFLPDLANVNEWKIIIDPSIKILHYKISSLVFQRAVNLQGEIIEKKNHKRTNGPVNAHLISEPSISINHSTPDKNVEQTLAFITHYPSFNLLVYTINTIPGHRMQ